MSITPHLMREKQNTTMADIQHLASLTEEDIKNRYITPAIDQAGWRKDQYRMEYPFTDGRIISAGSEYERASRKKADYVLYLNNDNLLAVVEAKSAGNDRITPEGFPEDSTRLPEFYNGTYEYLKSLGIAEI